MNSDRAEEPKFLPDNFWDMICHRYFPVLSLTYISSVFAIAMRHSPNEGNVITHIFDDPYPYDMALWIALWVSIPAVFWIIIRGSLRYRHRAAIWYKGIALMMVVTALLSYVLFPEMAFGNTLRLFMVATIPVFFIQYFFFVRGGLPARAAWPLTLAGLVFMLYGLIIV